MALNLISIVTAAGKDDRPFTPFVTIKLDGLREGEPMVQSGNLMTDDEIDAYIAGLKADIDELGARAKADLARAMANDPHRARK